MNTLTDEVDWEKQSGLVPAIVQNTANGTILMLGYMNPAALDRTLSTGFVTFFSRTRSELWTKGETSGNRLTLDSIALDCDRDSLLISATPAGPTCHNGTNSCFDGDSPAGSLGFFGELEKVIRSRTEDAADSSYTAALLTAGTRRIAQKVGEESVEVALAAASGDRKELISESADLLYHLLVLLKDGGSSLGEVAEELQTRHRNS